MNYEESGTDDVAERIKETIVDCRPTKRVLLSMRKRSFGWLKTLSEFADNSHDAGAKNINIELKPTELIFTDDGRGMSTEAMRLLFTLGGHLEYDTTDTGEFGVGFKDGAFWLWGDVEIASVSKGGGLRTARVNLEKWFDMDEWDVPVRQRDANPKLAAQTMIKIKKFERKPPTEKQWEEIVSTLGFRYGPTIEDGLHFTARWMGNPSLSLHPYAPMTIGSPMRGRVRMASGKTADVYAIQLDTRFQQRHSGVQYFRAPRLVLEDSPMGTGDYSRSGIYAVVRLDRSWKVGTNKDTLEDPDEEELFESVYKTIEPLLQKAQTSTILIRDSDLSLRISDLMNDAYRRQRKRRPGKGTGPNNNPSGKGGEGTKEDHTDGDSDKRDEGGQPKGFTIKFEDLKPEDGIGRKSKSGSVIELAKNNPFIGYWYNSDDREQAARVLALQAFWIFESDEEQIRKNSQLGLDFSPDESNDESTLAISSRIPTRVAARLTRIYADPSKVVRLAKG